MKAMKKRYENIIVEHSNKFTYEKKIGVQSSTKFSNKRHWFVMES